MKLGQIATISAGYPFRDKILEAPTSHVVTIQMKDVSPKSGINWNSCTKTNLLGKRNPIWLKSGDILFVARGNHNYAVLVDKGAEQLKAIAAPHFFIITCTSTQLLPAYLTWMLNQAFCQRYFQREAEGSHTKSIRRSVLEATPIIIPSLDKQKSIIQFADSLKKQRQFIKQLEQHNSLLMKAIANDLFKELT